jgi:hypothetical protein
MPQPRKRSSSGSSGGSSRSGSSKGAAGSRPSSARGRASSASSRSTSARSRATARRSSGANPGPARAAAAPREEPASTPPPASGANPVEQLLATLGTALSAGAAESLNLVLLSRERMQQAFDDAVQRGHMTQGTANALAADLIRRTQLEATNVLADVEQLLGFGRAGFETAAKAVTSVPGAERARREADRARRTGGGAPALPIEGYDDLTAAQITRRLDDLGPAELRKLRDYERRHGNRKSVLAAVERQLG